MHEWSNIRMTLFAPSQAAIIISNLYVGYHTHKITLPVMLLMVPVTLPILVMSAARTGTVRPFILNFF